MKIIKKLTKDRLDSIINAPNNPELIAHNLFNGHILCASRPDVGTLIASGYNKSGFTEKLAVFKPKYHIIVSLHNMCTDCPYSLQVGEDEFMNLADYLKEVHRLNEEFFMDECERIERSEMLRVWVYTNFIKYIATLNEGLVTLARKDCWVYTTGQLPKEFYQNFIRVAKPVKFYFNSGDLIPVRDSDLQVVSWMTSNKLVSSGEIFRQTLLKTYRSILNG